MCGDRCYKPRIASAAPSTRMSAPATGVSVAIEPGETDRQRPRARRGDEDDHRRDGRRLVDDDHAEDGGPSGARTRP